MSTLDNLIAYWRLDEASGIRYDSVGELRLDQSGTVGSNTGKLGTRCASLSTTSCGLHIGGTLPPDFSGTQLTVAGWFRIDSVSGATQYPIALIEVTNGTSSYRGLRVKYDNTTGYVYAETYDDIDSYTHSASSFGSLSTDTWYHLIATWNGTTVTLYVDNVSDSYAGHVSMSGHYELATFAFGNSSSNYSFSVDDWGIWNEIISSTDRSDLYNSGSGAIPPGLGTPAGTGNAAFFGFNGF
jgi:hypothetical protein